MQKKFAYCDFHFTLRSTCLMRFGLSLDWMQRHCFLVPLLYLGWASKIEYPTLVLKEISSQARNEIKISSDLSKRPELAINVAYQIWSECLMALTRYLRSTNWELFFQISGKSHLSDHLIFKVPSKLIQDGKQLSSICGNSLKPKPCISLKQ